MCRWRLNIKDCVAATHCLAYGFYTLWFMQVLLIRGGIIAACYAAAQINIALQGEQRASRHMKIFKNRLSLFVSLLYPRVTHQIFSIFRSRKLNKNES